MTTKRMPVLGVLLLLLVTTVYAEDPKPATPAVATGPIAPELQHAAAGLVTAATTGLTTAGDMAKDAVTSAAKFVQEQAPDVARQLVGYRLLSSLTPVIFASILGVFSLLVIFAVRKESWLEECPYGSITRYGMTALIFAVVAGISFFVAASFAPDVLQCYFTPKAVLFEMVRHAL